MKTKLKYFYVCADIGEGIPSYDFVLKCKNIDIACLKARKILKNDYQDEWEAHGKDGINFSCGEITAQELLERMCLN